MNGGLLASATACGVTPQAQNIGTSPARNGCASPQSGFVMSLMPSAAGSPICTGAPCAFGKRALAVTALDSCVDGIGRIETTIGPWNTPAGRHGVHLSHLATFLPCLPCQISMPASRSAHSLVDDQARTHATKSSRYEHVALVTP